ncbi:MAG: 50S ribosomal protein L9 [Planctomycetota bacterium]|nr:50S ribosomal protein L9 [Planctomycetota bacterium]MDA1179223.1 50S ribosomal protein L9 [Planctomycetota bacterium]
MTSAKTTVAAKTASRRQKNARLPRGPHGGIQLLLIQTIDHLGKQGDVVEVKRGYATNYLIPQGLATIATDHHKRMVDKHRAKLEAIELARLAHVRALAEAITKQSITVEANVNEEGYLYGSVGAADIQNGLKQLGYTVTEDQVRLQGPLKEVGLYNVVIRLHANVETELKVWVVPSAHTEASK